MTKTVVGPATEPIPREKLPFGVPAANEELAPPAAKLDAKLPKARVTFVRVPAVIWTAPPETSSKSDSRSSNIPISVLIFHLHRVGCGERARTVPLRKIENGTPRTAT